MRTLGSALAGALALSTAMPAHADPPGTKFSVSAAPAIVQPGTGSTSHPAPGFGGWHSAPAQVRQGNGVWVPAQNRPDGFRVPNGDGQAPLLFGEEHPMRPSTCPMCGETHTFPIATTVTGVRSGIPTQNGEALRGAGVIRNGSS